MGFLIAGDFNIPSEDYWEFIREHSVAPEGGFVQYDIPQVLEDLVKVNFVACSHSLEGVPEEKLPEWYLNEVSAEGRLCTTQGLVDFIFETFATNNFTLSELISKSETLCSPNRLVELEQLLIDLSSHDRHDLSRTTTSARYIYTPENSKEEVVLDYDPTKRTYKLQPFNENSGFRIG